VQGLRLCFGKPGALGRPSGGFMRAQNGHRHLAWIATGVGFVRVAGLRIRLPRLDLKLTRALGIIDSDRVGLHAALAGGLRRKHMS